jgi:hypothetical protein
MRCQAHDQVAEERALAPRFLGVRARGSGVRGPRALASLSTRRVDIPIEFDLQTLSAALRRDARGLEPSAALFS